MKRLYVSALSALMVFGFLTVCVTGRVDGRSEYSKAWQKKYVGDKKTNVQKKLAAAVTKVKKCNVCHDPRKIDGKISKKNRNDYGKALGKLLTKKDKKNTKKINDALTKVEKMGADKKKKLPSFGALLKAGKLPSVVKK